MPTDALPDDKVITVCDACNCERCGEPATCELRFPAVSDRWATYCGGCHQQIAEDCAEVAEHEIDHFGGAYGVPSFEARPIREPESMVDPCKRARELADQIEASIPEGSADYVCLPVGLTRDAVRALAARRVADSKDPAASADVEKEESR